VGSDIAKTLVDTVQVKLRGADKQRIRSRTHWRDPKARCTFLVAMNLREVFSGIKRLKVSKLSTAYAVVGWLLIQVATQVFPFLEIPNRAIRLVIVVTALGFPVALIIAWAFELTPEGIKRTEAADAARQRSRGGVWIAVVVIAAILSL